MSNRRATAFHAALLSAATGFAFAGASPTLAQQINGTPGSPDATTTIDGRYLPPPPPQPFTGQIELNAGQSEPAWPARIVPSMAR